MVYTASQVSLGKQVRDIYNSYALKGKSKEALQCYAKLAGAEKFSYKQINGMSHWVKDYFSSDAPEPQKQAVMNGMREINKAVRYHIMTKDLMKGEKYLPLLHALDDTITDYERPGRIAWPVETQPVAAPVAYKAPELKIVKTAQEQPAAPDSLYSRIFKGVKRAAAGALLTLAACAGMQTQEDYANNAKGAYDAYLQLSDKGGKDAYSVIALDSIIDAHKLYRLAENADKSSEQFRTELKKTDAMGKSMAPKALSRIDDRETFVKYEKAAREEGFLDNIHPDDKPRYEAALKKHGVGPYEGTVSTSNPFTAAKPAAPAAQPAPAAPAPAAQPAQPAPAAPAAQPGQQPAQPAQPAPAAQPQPAKPYSVYDEIVAPSNQSTQQRFDWMRVKTPLADALLQWHSYDEKAPDGDKIRQDGFGGYFNGKIWVVEGGFNYSQDTRKRTSKDSTRTSDPNFIITTDTTAVEKNESSYIAANAKADLGIILPKLTLWQQDEKVGVDTETLLVVDNLNDPAGDYAQVLSGSTSQDIITRGFNAGLEYPFAGDLLSGRIGAVGGVERTELSQDNSNYTAYRFDLSAFLHGNDEKWAGALNVGRRLFDDSERNRRYAPVHGSVTAAAEVGDPLEIGVPTTAFGRFWRLDQPGFALGTVFGSGKNAPLIVNHYNQLALNELDLWKELGPEERKAKMLEMNNNLYAALAADNAWRVMLSAGARRCEIDGDERWKWLAEGAIGIPVIKDLPAAAYFRREKDCLEGVIEGGVLVAPFGPAGPKFQVGGGETDVDGRKHPKAQFMKFGFGWEF